MVTYLQPLLGLFWGFESKRWFSSSLAYNWPFFNLSFQLPIQINTTSMMMMSMEALYDIMVLGDFWNSRLWWVMTNCFSIHDWIHIRCDECYFRNMMNFLNSTQQIFCVKLFSLLLIHSQFPIQNYVLGWWNSWPFIAEARGQTLSNPLPPPFHEFTRVKAMFLFSSCWSKAFAE